MVENLCFIFLILILMIVVFGNDDNKICFNVLFKVNL